MKQIVRVTDKVTGKTIVGEKEIRDFDHFQAQLKYKARIAVPKKGKGSFKRNKRVSEDE